MATMMTAKKKLLFVMPSLSAGGGEKSLVNLLSQLDYREYQVDLFLFKHDGIFMEFLPREVRVLSLPLTYRLFTLPLVQSLKQLVLQNKLSLAFSRMMFTFLNAYGKSPINEQHSWRYMAKSLTQLGGTYDAAIGFLEKTSIYFCVDKVQAVRKIGWIHTDYDTLGTDPNFDSQYFQQLAHIVTVSRECAHILSKRFPSQQHKVNVLNNIVSPKIIRLMADRGSDDIFARQMNEILILSIGRLSYPKNFRLAIEACGKLVKKGYNIRWSIIGEGEEREELMKLISRNKLEQHVILLGLKSNPYPYIKQSDIYVQPSRFEGKSIAIDEAKILRKPIVVTNFSTAKDQIEDGHNGLIVEMNEDAVAEGVERLIKDAELMSRLTCNLAKEELGTEAEIYKLYELIGESP